MTVTEAAEKFDTDAAGIWEMVADGTLTAERAAPNEPWFISVTAS